VLVAVAAAAITSLWVAICAAAPEFVWQGLTIAIGHTSPIELGGALLVGLILAFFVEPLMERVRDLVQGARRDAGIPRRRRNVFFAAGLALAFALASVCLHDAMTALVLRRADVAPLAALSVGMTLTISWAIVPLAIALAWLAARGPQIVRIVVLLNAAASPFLAGYFCSWSTHTIVTTALPCLVILGLGYRRSMREGGWYDPRFCANIVAVVGVAWLALAALANGALVLSGHEQLRFYYADGYWTDARFYLGWALGLLVAPPPEPLEVTRA